MTNTIEEAIAYARAHPKRLDYETNREVSWAGWCESFVYRAGGFTRSFSSAMLAGDASGKLNPQWGAAPRGAIHYWAGVGGDGHVAFELGGGLLLMASAGVTDEWGTALGTITFRDYSRKLIPYRGWTLRHGTETLASSSSGAGGNITPIEENELDATQAAQLAAANENAAEARKAIGVVIAKANEVLEAAVQILAQATAANENAAEARRQGGVILGAIPPAENESRPSGGGASGPLTINLTGTAK